MVAEMESSLRFLSRPGDRKAGLPVVTIPPDEGRGYAVDAQTSMWFGVAAVCGHEVLILAPETFDFPLGILVLRLQVPVPVIYIVIGLGACCCG